MCYKRLMERAKNREQEEWIGGGEEVPGSAFFSPPTPPRPASEDARPSVRETSTRAAIICPTPYVMRKLFTRHANLCGRWCMCFFSPVITSVRAAEQCSSPHQFHRLRSKVGEEFAARWLLTRSTTGAYQREYYTVHFHRGRPLWTDQSGRMRWIRILIECRGAVIKKNDYIFP